MNTVVIYTKDNCPYCKLAKELLKHQGLSFEEIRIDLDESKRDEMIERSQRRTVPQIFINNQSIGGFDDLANLVKSGDLKGLLK